MAVQLPLKLVTCVTSTAWLVMFQIYRRRASKKRQLYQTLLLDDTGDAPLSSTGAAYASCRGGALSRSTGEIVGAGTEPAQGPAPAGAQAHHEHKPYSAFSGQYFSIHVKIGNADPEQIRAGYRARIERVLAVAGLSLLDLYVRNGCIELTVDARVEAVVDREGSSTPTGCDVDIGALIRALQLEGQDGDDTDESNLLQNSTAEANMSDQGSDASSESMSSSATSFGSEDLSEPRLLATQCHSWTSRQGHALEHLNIPRITGLHPRVLAVPPPLAGPAAPGAALDESPTANVVISVIWPASYNGAYAGDVGSRELVLRSQGLYLPISVDGSDGGLSAGSGAGHGAGNHGDACPSDRADSSAAPDVAPRHGYLYNVQVSGLPPCTGLMLAEARMDGRICSRPVPVLVVDDPRVAAELVPAMMEWGGTLDELDALLVDLGTFFSQVAAAVRQQHEQQQQQAAQQASPRAGGGAASHVLHAWRLIQMGQHLLGYAQACNWERTVGRLRASLEQLPPPCTVELSSSESSVSSPPLESGLQEIQPCKHASGDSSGPAGPADERQAAYPQHGAGLGGACPATKACAGGLDGEYAPEEMGVGRGGPSHKRGTAAAAATAASNDSGLQNQFGRADREPSWSRALQGGIQMHCLLLELALLLLPLLHRRNGHLDLLAGGTAAGVLLGCAGAAAGISCLLLGSRVAPLLHRAAQPRLVSYLLVRSLQGALGCAVSSAVRAYELGAAFVLVEGIVRPAILMVEPRAAARMEVLKFPLYLLLWGSNFALWSVVARAAAVAGLSVGTSSVCAHVLRESGSVVRRTV